MKQRISVVSLALGGLFLALSVVAIWLGSAIQLLEYTLLGVASILISIFCLEAGAAGGLILAVATCLFCLLVVPNKLTILPLALFFAPYPLVKDRLEAWAGMPPGNHPFRGIFKQGKAFRGRGLGMLLGKYLFVALVSVVALTLFQEIFLGEALASIWMVAWTVLLILVGFSAGDVVLSGCQAWYLKRIRPATKGNSQGRPPRNAQGRPGTFRARGFAPPETPWGEDMPEIWLCPSEEQEEVPPTKDRV